MSNEVATEVQSPVTSLPPRAAIALLTLQLRAAQQEAAAAERAADEVQPERAVEQLRDRLGRLIDERRQALDAELEAARADASTTVAAAHRAARVIVSRTMSAAATTASAAPDPVEPAEVLNAPAAIVAPVRPAARQVEPDAVASVEVHADADPWTTAPAVDPASAALAAQADELVSAVLAEFTAVPAAAPSPPAQVPASAGSSPAELLAGLQSRPEPDAAMVWVPAIAPASAASVVDAQELATVFASVLATMLDDRMSRWSPAPAPKKPSFWSHVFHPDVVLVGIIMIVCMVVVAAWMS